jgi:hypothetical protein
MRIHELRQLCGLRNDGAGVDCRSPLGFAMTEAVWIPAALRGFAMTEAKWRSQ